MILERPAWQQDAACRGVGHAWFFTGRTGGRPSSYEWVLCDICPVNRECLAWAMASEHSEHRDMRYGSYAWSTPNDREQIHLGKIKGNNRKHCGTRLGYKAHRLWGEEPCKPCADRWAMMLAGDMTSLPIEIRHRLRTGRQRNAA